MSTNDLEITTRLRIPLKEISLEFTTSGGPGGQNVNRVATRVQLAFDIARSPSLSDRERQALSKALRRHMDTRGVLHLSCQTTRSQHQNRQLVVERFRDLCRKALRPRKRRIPTRKPRRANEERISRKKRRKDIKRLRAPIRHI